jgi:zinc/manganese transport system substrate-binding protein/manganese/iron transport system substrate-binding protein
MRRFNIVAAAAIMAVVLPLSSFAPVEAQPDSGRPIRALATTTQIQDFVRNVGGDRVTVIPILQGDEDAHGYQPTAADARAFADADVVFANGVDLETWLDRLARNTRPGVRIVKLGELPEITLRPGDESTSLGDPHVWFDPTNAQRMVAAIRDTLASLDPNNQSSYQQNSAYYISLLEGLDREIMARWEPVPVDQRKLVTNHEAFGYYVARYGITFVGSVLAMSTEGEPSAAETLRLIQDIRAENVRAIFTEGSINPRLAEQISQQTGVRIVSNLYGDSLGKPGSDGDTYLKMMRHNTATMIAGMTG